MPSSVNLGEQLEAFINRAVRNGRYGSRSEVLREGVRLVEEREKRLEQLDQALAVGLDDLEAGQVTDAGPVFEQLIAALEARAAKPAARGFVSPDPPKPISSASQTGSGATIPHGRPAL